MDTTLGVLLFAWLLFVGVIVARNLFFGARHTVRAINRSPAPWVAWYWVATVAVVALIALLTRR